MSDRSIDPEPAIGSEPPRLSMLIACWNAAATIERALASVLDEHGVPFECIVIDDGSTDGTADIVQAVADRDARVVLLRLPANAGVSAARNHGLDSARGDWVAFHDADDVMLPGWLGALMGPTRDPAVRAVIGQRIWSDGQRTWLSARYDIPDIREPGRKSIATHPGLVYYASATGKVFHRSLLDGLPFEGRVMGDQPWTIRALLRAGPNIEVVAETVFEWWRPGSDASVETITTRARGSAAGAAAMAVMARTAFLAVSAEVDARIDSAPTREAVKHAYFDRLLVSDLSGPVREAARRRDPEASRLFDALTDFLDAIPRSILATSAPLPRQLLRPPAVHWKLLPHRARGPYWRMVRQALGADPTMARRIAWRRAVELAFVFARVRPPLGPLIASTVLSTATILKGLVEHERSP